MFETLINLPDEAATRALGASLARVRRRGDVIALCGPLGVGKSLLARAYIEAATGTADAPSPTFGLVHLYEASGGPIHHFDLYRLARPEDVEELGLDDAIEEGVCLIEWPESVADRLPPSTFVVRLAMAGDGRQATLRGETAWRERLNAVNAPSTASDQ